LLPKQTKTEKEASPMNIKLSHVGVDLHKARSWFYVMDEAGRKVSSRSIANSAEELKQHFATIPQPFLLAVEATYNWYFFVDLAEEYAEEVYLANSYELKAFAKRHKKTDKIDARLIADVLRKGYLPTVTIPDRKTRRLKELLNYRINLVADRSRNIARLKAILDKLGEDGTGRFTTYKRLRTITVDHLPMEYQQTITGYINRIEYLSRALSEAEKNLEHRALDDPDIVNLMSLPGISYFSAALIKSELIDIGRFRSFNRLCAYAGLAPRVHQSGNHCYHGGLNVNRRKKLQWILIEAVYHYIRALPEKQQRYEAIARRKGHNSAKVALARDLLKMIYHILRERRLFYRFKLAA